MTIPANGFYAQEWTFGEHSGTHMDAPGHFVAGGRFVPQLRPAELVLPIVVIDIAARAARNPDAEVTADDIRRFERAHGRIPRDALVAMHSGWGTKLGTPAFTGRDDSGVYHFPGFSEGAIDMLIAARRAAAIGVDTLSLDNGPSTTFVVHTKWLGADNYGLENLTNLDKIPAHGATAMVGVDPVGGRARAARRGCSRPTDAASAGQARGGLAQQCVSSPAREPDVRTGSPGRARSRARAARPLPRGRSMPSATMTRPSARAMSMTARVTAAADSSRSIEAISERSSFRMSTG